MIGSPEHYSLIESSLTLPESLAYLHCFWASSAVRHDGAGCLAAAAGDRDPNRPRGTSVTRRRFDDQRGHEMDFRGIVPGNNWSVVHCALAQPKLLRPTVF